MQFDSILKKCTSSNLTPLWQSYMRFSLTCTLKTDLHAIARTAHELIWDFKHWKNELSVTRIPVLLYFTVDSTTTRSTALPRIPSKQRFTTHFFITIDNGSSLLSICTPTCLQRSMQQSSSWQLPWSKTPIRLPWMVTLVRVARCLGLSYRIPANASLPHLISQSVIANVPSWTVTHSLEEWMKRECWMTQFPEARTQWANPESSVSYRLWITQLTCFHVTWPLCEVKNDSEGVVSVINWQFLT